MWLILVMSYILWELVGKYTMDSVPCWFFITAIFYVCIMFG